MMGVNPVRLQEDGRVSKSTGVIAAMAFLGALIGAAGYFTGGGGRPPVEKRVATGLFDATPAVAPEAAPPPVLAEPDDLAQETAQDIAERAEVDAEQVADAAWVLDAVQEADDKASAIAQLSAYPTRESETLMIKALQLGTSAEERDAAAQGLGQVEKPKAETVYALLKALDDVSEEVQSSAAMTLQDMAERLKKKSPLRKKIIAGFKAAQAGNRLFDNPRELVESYLENW